MYRLSLATILIGLFLSTDVGAQLAVVTLPQATRLQPCQDPASGDGAQCGTLSVYENRETNRGRKIDLKIVVLPATGPDKMADPVFILGGGPGQAVAGLAGAMNPRLAGIRSHRDIVFVDQRGTGGSNGFNCDLTGPSLSNSTGFRYPPDRIDACLKKIDADPKQYSTNAFVDDLDDVRASLGYDKINVAGGSYGSWAALVYLRRHPDHVRSLVLQSVVPPDAGFPAYLARGFQRALDRLAVDCLADPACREANGNIRVKAQEVADRLTRHPFETTAADGRPISVTRDVFSGTVGFMLYVPQFAVTAPKVITAAHNGDYAPLVSRLVASAGFGGGISWGLFLSVTCAEAMPHLTTTDEDLARNTISGVNYLTNLRETCRRWPKGKVRDSDPEPVASTVPALLISGAEDPAAPPELGDQAARYLPNAFHVVLPGQGHTPFGPACSITIMTAFLQDTSADNLDLTCVSTLGRPPFPEALAQAKTAKAQSQGSVPAASDTTLAGDWEGEIKLSALGANDLAIVIHFTVDGTTITGTFDAPTSGTTGRPIDSVVSEGDSIRMERKASAGPWVMKGVKSGTTIEGEFTQGQIVAPFILRKSHEEAKPTK